MLKHNKSIEAFQKKRNENLKKYGWVIDMVMGEDSHTHGLVENMEHTDLQIILNLQPELIQYLMSEVVSRIKKGAKFKSKERLAGILADPKMEIEFLEVMDVCRERKLLRIIIPDPQGNLDPKTMDEAYKVQFNAPDRN